MIQGEKISLQPVTRDDLELLEAWTNDPQFLSEYNTFGLRNTVSLEQRFNEDGLLSSHYGRLLVVTPDDEIAGYVSYNRISRGPNEGSAGYNIGINLAPQYHGRGYGSEAQKLLATYLFATYPVMRLEALTDKENIAEQRALEKAGFTCEGVLRKAQWRNGDWHDLFLYSKLRGE